MQRRNALCKGIYGASIDIANKTRAPLELSALPSEWFARLHCPLAAIKGLRRTQLNSDKAERQLRRPLRRLVSDIFDYYSQESASRRYESEQFQPGFIDLDQPLRPSGIYALHKCGEQQRRYAQQVKDCEAGKKPILSGWRAFVVLRRNLHYVFTLPSDYANGWQNSAYHNYTNVRKRELRHAKR